MDIKNYDTLLTFVQTCDWDSCVQALCFLHIAGRISGRAAHLFQTPGAQRALFGNSESLAKCQKNLLPFSDPVPLSDPGLRRPGHRRPGPPSENGSLSKAGSTPFGSAPLRNPTPCTGPKMRTIPLLSSLFSPSRPVYPSSGLRLSVAYPSPRPTPLSGLPLAWPCPLLAALPSR